ncbi:hypothetical protein, partial [Raoultella ornithinolytica]|uniref:hypothetical protein n=1 Tax=Raoultella ornithinolytica TaxID=54291 RepID=UPI001953ED80
MAFEDGVGGVESYLFKLRAKRRERKKRHKFRLLRQLTAAFAKRIRIQNLRFAHFLCDAQLMGNAAYA